MSWQKLDNVLEAKESFIASDDARSPRHTYGKLAAVDFEQVLAAYDLIKVEAMRLLSPREQTDFLNKVDFSRKKAEYLRTVQYLHQMSIEADKRELLDQIRSLNTELWGEADEQTYLGLLGESVASIDESSLDSNMQGLFREYKSLLLILKKMVFLSGLRQVTKRLSRSNLRQKHSMVHCSNMFQKAKLQSMLKESQEFLKQFCVKSSGSLLKAGMLLSTVAKVLMYHLLKNSSRCLLSAS